MFFKTLPPIGVMLLAVSALPSCVDMGVENPAARFVAFGDSATMGPAMRDYVDALIDLTGQPSDVFSNEGRGGESSADGLSRLTTSLEFGFFPNAEVLLYWQGGVDLLEFVRAHDPLFLSSPDAADFAFGDDLAQTLDAIQSNVESAIQRGQEAGLTVVVANYYPFATGTGNCDAAAFNVLLPSQANVVNRYVDLLNERISLAADQRGALLVDVASVGDELLADSTNYFNCNHLSGRGNERVAELFRDALAANINRPTDRS